MPTPTRPMKPHETRSPFTKQARFSSIGSGVRLACAAAAALVLNGCAWTLITAADAAGSLVQAGFAVSSHYSSPTFVNGDPVALHNVCIEWNQTVSVSDFVPALQLALFRRGVRSDVYNPGASPPGCEARLVYNAAVDYGRDAFSSDAAPYLSAIDLTLIQNGRIAVSARYTTQGLSSDRFASASTKLRGMIDRMVLERSTEVTQVAKSSPND
ncbi:hypothetical protein [Trinickia violacea]|uniref:hypothetical protein n=1 Tax=Trinickia violacea TaxID=2571746 RepID=UPI0020C799A5|nr:hypothetical protein [Trinickia violacea]